MNSQTTAIDGDLLWRPSASQIDASGLAAFERWLVAKRGLRFDSYTELWQWSVDQLELFWQAIWDYFELQADGSREPVLASHSMPGAVWYPNARLNYAEHIFRNATAETPALIVRSEDAPIQEVSWAQLQRDTGALAATMRGLGVAAGDRVASYLPNRAETVVAFLACASIGAIWSSCSPDMGPGVVLDRFRQIEPKLLLASDSYSYNGKTHDRVAVIVDLLRELPSVKAVLHVTGPNLKRAVSVPTQAVPWRGVTDQLHEGSLAAARLCSAHTSACDQLDRLATAARCLSLGLRRDQIRSMDSIGQRWHRHRVRLCRLLTDTAGQRRRDSVSRIRRLGLRVQRCR